MVRRQLKYFWKHITKTKLQNASTRLSKNNIRTYIDRDLMRQLQPDHISSLGIVNPLVYLFFGLRHWWDSSSFCPNNNTNIPNFDNY